MVQPFPPIATVEIAAEQVDKLAKADSRNKGAVWGWVAGRSAAKSHNDGIVLNGVEGRRNSRRTAESMYVDVPAVGPINEGLRTMARDKRRRVYASNSEVWSTLGDFLLLLSLAGQLSAGRRVLLSFCASWQGRVERA